MKKQMISSLAALTLLSSPLAVSANNYDGIETVTKSEQEPNNALNKAQQIETFIQYYGKTSTQKDPLDYFKFTINRDSVFSFEFSLGSNFSNIRFDNVEENEEEPKGYYKDAVKLTILNEQQEVVKEYSLDTNDTISFSEVVEAGDYYIKVNRLKDVDPSFYHDNSHYLTIWNSPKIERHHGSSRYYTSIDATRREFSSAETVVLATGENFPDALSAAPLAATVNGPIMLLDEESDYLIKQIMGELDRLGTKNLYLIGGKNVISPIIEGYFKSEGFNVTRLGGKDRYETAVKIAEELPSTSEVAIVNGSTFADALAISSVAASKGMPILLTEGSYVPSTVTDYLEGKDIKASYVIGGTAVIEEHTLKELPNSQRIAGEDRYGTSTEVTEFFEESLDYSSVYFASGQDFPDALVGGPIASRKNAPLLLVNNGNEDQSTSTNILNFIDDNKTDIDAYTFIGGSAAIHNETVYNLIKFWE